MHSLRSIIANCLIAAAALSGLAMGAGCSTRGVGDAKSWVLITETDGETEVILKASTVTPSARQLEWQGRELIAFIHFGLFRNVSPAVFNPVRLDARQWVRVCQEAGMKMVVLTTKHHAGFCLWPSAFTDYSVKASPWRNGQGDLVREVAEACREAGLEFGVYVSPWDMHEPTYGTPEYDEFFKNQLRELLSNYGPIAEVWFDGHYGGPKEKKQEYKWHDYYRLIRELQPAAVIAINGPDVRWVGNEKGFARENEWSVVPALADGAAVHGGGGAGGPSLFIPPLNRTAENLGDRDVLKGMSPPYYLVWYPAETDVSIRPSWSFRADEKPWPLGKLLDIYYNSVGRNSVLLLNFTPNDEGLIPEEDIVRAREFRAVINATFETDLALRAKVIASSQRFGHRASAVTDGESDTYWTTPEGISHATLELDLGTERKFNRIMLQEHIRTGQRIEEFRLETWDGDKWREFARGTTVGYKRLLRIEAVTSRRIRLVIAQSRSSPALSKLGLYLEPPLEPVK